MHNFIKKMKLLRLRKFNSDATDYVQSTQPTQTNLYSICYRRIRRHISFFITPIILSLLIACGGPEIDGPGGDGPGGGGGGGGGDDGPGDDRINPNLSAVLNLRIETLDASSLMLSWDSVSGAESYQVYSGDRLIATVDHPTTSYTATGLLPNTMYAYRVEACNSLDCTNYDFDSFGTTYEIEEVDSYTVAAGIGQGTPSLNVSWSRTPGATYYQIFNATNSKIATVPAPATSHIITDLSSGTRYGYYVKGCYESGGSEVCGNRSFGYFGVIAYAFTLPAIPRATVTGLGYTAIKISWDGVFGATSYQVHNSEGLVATITPPVTHYAAHGLSTDINYTYSIRACNSSGCSAFASGSAIAMAVRISNANELAAISTDRSSLSGDYVLTESIDLSAIPNWHPIGNYTHKFTGNFDGKGYNISGLGSSGHENAGLFGYIEGASISNLGVLGSSIDSTTITGTGSFSSSTSASPSSGGLVGRAVGSQISNSYAEMEVISSISGHLGGSYLTNPFSSSGGLVGRAEMTQISNSYALVSGGISSSAYNSASAGGLVGNSMNNQISDSYTRVMGVIYAEAYLDRNLFSGSLTSTSSGALVGSTYRDEISNSYAAVKGISAFTYGYNVGVYARGLFGSADISQISNSYYSATTEPSRLEFNNTRRTEDKLRGLTAATTGWDNTIWNFGTNADFPTFHPLPASNIAQPPASVTATELGLTAIRISWEGISNAISYQVHNSSGLVATVIHPATNYTDSGLSPNVEYAYRIRACNLSGCSLFSNDASATTGVVIISSAAELAAIFDDRSALSGDYILTGNIDLPTTPNWRPIGNYINRFTGSFNGNGYNISGVSSSGYEYAGLFGYVENANISNVGVLVGNISATSNAGGLVGMAIDSSISNSYAEVVGSISDASNSGGLVGRAAENSQISNSYAEVVGNISAIYNAGGLIGRADENSQISNSHAVIMGYISSSSNDDLRTGPGGGAGGLVGYAIDSSISNSYAEVTGSISAKANSGGLVGHARDNPISNSHAVVTGDIYATFGSSRVGGLVGLAEVSRIRNSYAIVEGNIYSLRGASFLGGLVGYVRDNPISNSYALVTGDIYATSGSSRVGGLVGLAEGRQISDSYAVVLGVISSPVTINPSSTPSTAGGLVGMFSASAVNSYYSAMRKSGEGVFSNSFGLSRPLVVLRELTATSSRWDGAIWDFGTDNDLPMLFDNPLTSPLPPAFLE